MYYDYHSDLEYVDIYQLQRLPQFVGMTDYELRAFVQRLNKIEADNWARENRERLQSEREKTLAYIEEKKHVAMLPALPKDEVKIGFGWTICPSWVDDHGFIKEDFAKGLRRTIRLSLDNKRKIYIH
jgi:hypothetical protein